MGKLAELLHDDWKTEKHVPVIQIENGSPEAGQISIRLAVGDEIAHPNTTEHHIRWIELYFLPAGENFPYQLGHYEFIAHGASVGGPDSSTVYSEPAARAIFSSEKAGTLIAKSYCNVHGLWTNEFEI